MALLEEMMKNMPSLSGEAKDELRKSFRHNTRRKSIRRVYYIVACMRFVRVHL